MAGRVVQQLEGVKIGHDDGQGTGVTMGSFDLARQLFVEVSSIVEAGQGVGDGELVDLFGEICPDAAVRERILVDNPTRMYWRD